jgi:hypothetical protein
VGIGQPSSEKHKGDGTLRRTRSGHFKLLPEKHVSFEDLKEGRKELVQNAMLSLYDVSKLRGA